jgi:hypothetical protein
MNLRLMSMDRVLKQDRYMYSRVIRHFQHFLAIHEIPGSKGRGGGWGLERA